MYQQNDHMPYAELGAVNFAPGQLPVEIILGKEGTQPFAIEATGVSRQHAKITIDQNGQWFLEDLGSLNGTFVRNEHDGSKHRVSRLAITPMTFIYLGPDNSLGCKFYARQAVVAGNFTAEMQYLVMRDQEVEEDLKKQEQKALLLRRIISGLTLIALGVSFLLPKEQTDLKMNLLRIGTILSSLYTIIYNPQTERKKIVEKRNRLFDCPNPCCSRKLSSQDVKAMQCPGCKGKVKPNPRIQSSTTRKS